MDITQFLQLIGTRWLLIVALVVSGGLGAFGYSSLQAPTYAASTQLFVSMNGGTGDNNQLNQGNNFIQQRVKSYSAIVSSPTVAERVALRLGLSETPESLANKIEVSSPIDTVLLDITVHDASAERARDIANAVATEFGSVVAEIETPPGRTSSPVKISITREATASKAPVSPRTGWNTLLGVLAGLTAGLGFAVMRHKLDRTIRLKSDAIKVAGAPILGSVPDEAKIKGTPLIVDEQATPRAEAFRQLRTNIRFLSVDRRLSSFVVTGSLPDEGKTTTAANLAIALAQAGQTIVLVDADLRRSSVADLFALSNGVGLTNVLLGDVPVNHALQHWREDLPLYILTAGPRPPNPSELLGSARLAKVIASLEASGMTVIFDSPPLLPVTDAALIAKVTGGALVVTRVGRTRTDQLAEAVEALRAASATVLGVVVNRVKGRKEKSYSSYYDIPSPRRSRSRR